MSNHSDDEHEHKPEDIFDGFEDFAVEQMANVAQLVAEARRLGLVPELPREVLEKLDLGGTMMDVLRLQLKHATALASLLGPKGRNLEKLNRLSALMNNTGKSRFTTLEAKCAIGGFARYSLVVDNPVDRIQKCEVTLGRLKSTHDTYFEAEMNEIPVGDVDELSDRGAYPWALIPPVAELDPREVRTMQIVIPALDRLRPGNTYELTALVKLSPLGSTNRYLLRLEIDA